MPDEFGILETFDLLFKIHKVFNLSFEVNLKNMFCFIQNYVYKQIDRDMKPTNRMTDIFSKLSLWKCLYVFEVFVIYGLSYQ